jgi:hypothetical protein
MFFNNIQKNQPAANVDQQSTVESTPESTLCVELSDEELCAVNGGSVSTLLTGSVVNPLLTATGVAVINVGN